MDMVGGSPTHLKNLKVNWDDKIPNIWENKTCSKPPTSQLNGKVQNSCSKHEGYHYGHIWHSCGILLGRSWDTSMGPSGTTLKAPHSTFNSPHIAHSRLLTPHFKLHIPHFTRNTPHQHFTISTLHNLRSHMCLYIPVYVDIQHVSTCDYTCTLLLY